MFFSKSGTEAESDYAEDESLGLFSDLVVLFLVIICENGIEAEIF
jgi:hypothetical protein